MMLSIFDTLFSLYAKASSLPFIIQICVVFIFGCILLFSIFLSIISYSRYLHEKRKKREEKQVPIIDELILKYLLEDTDRFSHQTIYNDFTKQLGTLNLKNLNLITQQLIKFKNNFDLNVSDQFNKINMALRIGNHIEKKFSFSSDYQKMKGIQELSTLAISAAESNIFPFTYSSNKSVRKEARTSYIRLSKNDPFKFFDDANEQLNEWDQINLMKHLMSLETKEMPNFSKWVSYSVNESIVGFSIKMCAYFNQQDSIPVLIDFLRTNNHQLRAETIKALGELNATKAEDTLKNIYSNQPDNCQIEILKAVGKLNSGNAGLFLKDAFENAINVETKKVAGEALHNYHEKGKEYYQELINTETGFNLLILKHIANPLIKFK